MTRIPSASEIKRSCKPSRRLRRNRLPTHNALPEKGSKLRAFYDALIRESRAGMYYSRPDNDLDKREYMNHCQMIAKLRDTFACDIVPVRDMSSKYNKVIGWRILGEHVGDTYVHYTKD